MSSYKIIEHEYDVVVLGAGGSGVIKDLPDNSKVMGYPAKNIRKFLRENRWFIKQQLLILKQKFLPMLR